MTLDISLSDTEVSNDPVASLFRVSALLSDHATRLRQGYLNRDVDLGQGLNGRVIAVDHKTVTLKGTAGERRTIPLTSKRTALLSHATHSSSSTKRNSPRKQASNHTIPTATTTRK